MLLAIGMEAFAERARRELIATGEKVRKRSVETRDQLTPQEEQIARLARAGMSNREIGTQLFISGRTVEWAASRKIGSAASKPSASITSVTRRTTSTFSRDIAYSRSPAASRASASVR
jgi:DNA-binding CsgD family transcriptional regulator